MRAMDRVSLNEVERANSLLDVVAEHGIELVDLAPWLRAGRCPLCREPVGLSFLVFVRDRRFECTVCRFGGDVIGLTVWLEHLGFMCAVARLCRRAGLDFDELFPEEGAALPSSRRQRELPPEWALTPPPFLTVVRS